MKTHYEGRAYAYDHDQSLPSTSAVVRTPDKSGAFQLRLDLRPINPRTGDPSSWNDIAPLFPPTIDVPHLAEVNISLQNDTLDVSWKTNINTWGSAKLPKSRAGHAVPTNSAALSAFRHYVTNLWRRSLQRRSQKDGFTWRRIAKLADDWLPKPRILHPWPSDRFAVKHPRWKPYARIGHVRICAGALSNERSYRDQSPPDSEEAVYSWLKSTVPPLRLKVP